MLSFLGPLEPRCCNAYEGTRPVSATQTIAFAWRHAPDRTPPAPWSPPRAALSLSLARERFAEKRASGSQPRRVARRSRLRPEAEASVACNWPFLAAGLEREQRCLIAGRLFSSQANAAIRRRPRGPLRDRPSGGRAQHPVVRPLRRDGLLRSSRSSERSRASAGCHGGGSPVRSRGSSTLGRGGRSRQPCK
jgi:hypothetical protein